MSSPDTSKNLDSSNNTMNTEKDLQKVIEKTAECTIKVDDKTEFNIAMGTNAKLATGMVPEVDTKTVIDYPKREIKFPFSFTEITSSMGIEKDPEMCSEEENDESMDDSEETDNETDDDMTSGPVTKKDNQRFTSFSKIELDKWPSLIEMSSGEEDAESMEGSENEMDDSGTDVEIKNITGIDEDDETSSEGEDVTSRDDSDNETDSENDNSSQENLDFDDNLDSTPSQPMNNAFKKRVLDWEIMRSVKHIHEAVMDVVHASLPRRYYEYSDHDRRMRQIFDEYESNFLDENEQDKENINM